MVYQAEGQEEGTYLCEASGIGHSVRTTPTQSPVIRRGETATQPKCAILSCQCDCDGSKHLRLVQTGKQASTPCWMACAMATVHKH